MMLIYQKSKVLLIVAFLVTILFNQAVFAQKSGAGQGYYVNSKGEKVQGVFDLEFINNNSVRFKDLKQDAVSRLLPINEVEKIVVFTENKDSSVILTQKLVFNGTEEKIYLQYLQKGEINLFRGYSKIENQVFYISTNDLPDLRKINRADPKQFFTVYFKGCEETKRKITEVLYERTSLELALRQYAECSHKSMAEQSKAKTQVLKKKPISVGFAVQGGLFKPDLGAGYYKEAPFKLISSSTGLNVNLQMEIFDGYTLSCGYNYSFSKMVTTNSTVLYPNIKKIGFNKSDFVPIELKYKYQKEPQKIGYGVSFGFLASRISNFKIDGKDIPKTTITKGSGLLATVGINKQLSKLLTLECGVKYTMSFVVIVPPDSYLPKYNPNDEVLLSNIQNFDAFARLLVNLRQ